MAPPPHPAEPRPGFCSARRTKEKPSPKTALPATSARPAKGTRVCTSNILTSATAKWAIRRSSASPATPPTSGCWTTPTSSAIKAGTTTATTAAPPSARRPKCPSPATAPGAWSPTGRGWTGTATPAGPSYKPCRWNPAPPGGHCPATSYHPSPHRPGNRGNPACILPDRQSNAATKV